jgi:hypothetical protein
MPGFDGTGPMGMGPMTGGGRGFCNPYGPLRGGGFMPPAYWPRPTAPPFGAAYPPLAGYAAPMYGYGFGPQSWPTFMGGMARFWGGRAGFGPGMGMGRGPGMGRGMGRGRRPVSGW